MKLPMPMPPGWKAEKSGLPNIFPSTGLTMSFVKALTRSLKAVAITTATASSTMLPRRTKSRKPLSTHSSLRSATLGPKMADRSGRMWEIRSADPDDGRQTRRNGCRGQALSGLRSGGEDHERTVIAGDRARGAERVVDVRAGRRYGDHPNPRSHDLGQTGRTGVVGRGRWVGQRRITGRACREHIDEVARAKHGKNARISEADRYRH